MDNLQATMTQRKPSAETPSKELAKVIKSTYMTMAAWTDTHQTGQRRADRRCNIGIGAHRPLWGGHRQTSSRSTSSLTATPGQVNVGGKH